MPFNSETYQVNKARRERDQHMHYAKRAKWAAQTTDDGMWRKAHLETMRRHVQLARFANTHLRFALRIKAISNAPVTDFAPGGKYHA